MKDLNFSQAFRLAKEGYAVCRTSWRKWLTRHHALMWIYTPARLATDTAEALGAEEHIVLSTEIARMEMQATDWTDEPWDIPWPPPPVVAPVEPPLVPPVVPPVEPPYWPPGVTHGDYWPPYAKPPDPSRPRPPKGGGYGGGSSSPGPGGDPGPNPRPGPRGGSPPGGAAGPADHHCGPGYTYIPGQGCRRNEPPAGGGPTITVTSEEPPDSAFTDSFLPAGHCFFGGSTAPRTLDTLAFNISITGGPVGLGNVHVDLDGAQVQLNTAGPGFSHRYEFTNVSYTPGLVVACNVNYFIASASYTGSGTYTFPDWCGSGSSGGEPGP